MGADRAQALQRVRTAVEGFVVEGPKLNLPFFQELLADEEFISGRYDTELVARMRTRRGPAAAARDTLATPASR